MEYYGYAGKVLHVDLTSGAINVTPLDLDLATKFIGGMGISSKFAYDLMRPDIDPLSPESAIIIGIGTLVGTLVPCASKTTVVMKLPYPASKREKKYVVATLTGGGMRFGAMLKYAGYDQVIITGRARKPSYLKIRDDDIEICDASELWGKADPFQTTDYLSNRYKGATGKAGVWAIGKGGENLLSTATGFVDNVSSLGTYGAAVLGSKNLKAVVALGTKGIRIADRQRFMKSVDKVREEILSHPSAGKLGRNYKRDKIVGEPVYPENAESSRLVQKGACFSCVDGCKNSFAIKEGRFKGQRLRSVRPKHLTRHSTRLRLEDYDELLKLSDLINKAGVCDRSVVRMLHFVTRLFERGVISTKETGGLVLKTGDFAAYVKLLDKLVNREDIGEYMAQGWYALSEKVGVDASTDFTDGCAIINGFSVGSEPQRFALTYGVGLANILSPRGMNNRMSTNFPLGEDRHRDTYWPEFERSVHDVRRDCERMGTSREDIERIFTGDGFNDGRLVRHAEDAYHVYQCVGTCWFGGKFSWDRMRDVPLLSELYSAATGFEITPLELKKGGERARNMEKLLNMREGFTRADEEIPALWLHLTETPLKTTGGDRYLVDWLGRRLSRGDIVQILDDYYIERGWDMEKGIPTKEKLAELGLAEYEDILSLATKPSV